MSHNEASERVLLAIQPIEALLCRAMLEAVTSAETAATGGLKLPRKPAYQATRVHMARAKARYNLENEHLGAWTLNEFETRNSALHLYTDGIGMRFLHTPSGVAPAPGGNHARRAWYTARLEDDDASLVSPDIKLLALWSADFHLGLVDLRVVRPVRPWAYGARELVDISIPLDPNSAFTSAGYDSRDEEEDLPFPTRDQAAEREEDTNSASA